MALVSKSITQKAKTMAPIGASLVVGSSFFYASYGIWTKLMGDFFGGYTASAFRSVLVVLMLVLIAITYKKLQPLDLKKNWPHILGMTVASCLIWGPLYFAILEAGIGISLTINYACIVIGMFFLGWLFMGERFTKDKWLSAILGLGGLALVFSPTTEQLGLLALAAAAISGLATAVNMILTKKVSYNATQTTLVLWCTSIVANFLMAYVFAEAMPSFALQVEWLYLIGFAVSSVIASWSFIKGLKLIDAGVAGLLGLLEIVFGVVFGVAFFGERPGAVALVGVAIIIIATAIPYLRELNEKRLNLQKTTR